MATPTVRDEIRGWLSEMLSDVEQEGTLSGVILMHYDGNHNERDVHSMKAGGAKWGDAEKMAELFFQMASRHARGLIGAQQFQLQAVFGGADRATRVLPFGLPGQLQFGAIPGGLATEPPTTTGQASQGMRLAELVTQGMIAQIHPTFNVQASLIDRLMRRQAELEAENRELFLALREELRRTVVQAHEIRMKELQYIRNTEAMRRALKLLPAFLNGIMSKQIFPESVEDQALIETLCENLSEDDIKLLATGLGQKSPELSALVLNRFTVIQKRKKDEQAELGRLAREARGDYESGERDAGGEPTRPLDEPPGAAETLRQLGQRTARALEGAPAPATNGHANGHANGANGNGSQVVEVRSSPDPELAEDKALLDDLFGTVADSEIDMLVGVLGMKDPKLAERLKARHGKVKR